jgi:Metallo-peptidase family M12B Reprolysin-like/Secretion system C-terminal sorting domain
MKKIYQVSFSILFLLSFSFSLLAQNSFFTPMSESAVSLANGNRVIVPTKYNTVKADINQLKSFLWSLPSEKNVNQNLAPILQIPMPDGRMVRFRVWESSIQEPALEAKFPEIKTFAGQGIDDRYASIRFDIGPRGFHAQVLTINGSYYIDPYTVGSNITDYISYFRKDLMNNNGKWTCDVPDHVPTSTNNIIAAACRGTEMRTYRLAVACTGEYAQAPGINAGTNPAILHNAIVTSVNRVVGVYRTELSISMTLVATNNLVEFLNAATDPFNGNNNSNVLINESQVVCDGFIGSANYDIGHTFSTGGGGLAQLNSPCGSSKARGITGSPSPTGDAYDIDYVAHEMGHQFGGNHSMAGCGSSPNSTKYEVGSGTTIQAYAGICGAENIQPNSDPFFHAISFDEISNFVSGTGSGCGVLTATSNQIPVIGTLSNNGANIPISTPFTLTGTATDPDNDPLTYCWEQWDFSGTATWNAGATAAPGNTVPLFKSRIPKTTGSRTFPDIAVILAGYPANPPSAMGGLKGETLSPVDRAMKFKLTVRDNKVAGGGVASSGAGGCQSSTVFQINVIATSGPFAVTIPNGGESYAGGSTQTITWNTVGTNNAPINVANVMISLSTDGGLTYPTVLSASTPNDGTEAFTIPVGITTTARIKIEAIGNIFFDISNANFSITSPLATFDFTTPPAVSVTCGTAATANITLATTSSNGYTTPVNLVAAGNPAGTTVSYSVNPVTPGNSTVVTLNGINTLIPGTYPITITGTSGTIVKTVTLTYTVNTGAGPSIGTQPVSKQVCIGLNTNFNVVSTTATGYQWQLSTNGGGNWSNLSNTAPYSGVTTSALNITGALIAMNTYQYRVIVSGQCGSTITSVATLTVNPLPTVTAISSAASICSGSSVNLTASGADTYTWSAGTTPATGAVVTAIPVVNSTYTVTGTVTATGCINTASVSVIATPKPTLILTASPFTNLMPGLSTTITATASSATTNNFIYTWSYTGPGPTPAFAGNTHLVNLAGRGTYTVTAADASNLACVSLSKSITIGDSASTKLFVFPSPNNGRFTVSYYTAGASSTNPTKQNITIYDSYGRRVLNKEYPVTQAYQLHQMDLRRNGTGVYYIVLREANGNKIKTGEVVVR